MKQILSFVFAKFVLPEQSQLFVSLTSLVWSDGAVMGNKQINTALTILEVQHDSTRMEGIQSEDRCFLLILRLYLT